MIGAAIIQPDMRRVRSHGDGKEISAADVNDWYEKLNGIVAKVVVNDLRYAFDRQESSSNWTLSFGALRNCFRPEFIW